MYEVIPATTVCSIKGLEIISKCPSIRGLVSVLPFNYTVEFCRHKKERGSFVYW